MGSSTTTVTVKHFKNVFVYTVPALEDNYMYLIGDKNTNQAAVVDPVKPTKLIELLEKEKLTLTTVLSTHRHWDHAGGNKELLSLPNMSQVKIYGGSEKVEGVTNVVGHNSVIEFGSIKVGCLATPCHTTESICYRIDDEDESFVFTGDTLFLGGCGRFFEGNAEQMHTALNKTLASLPDKTHVFCGHEYILGNLKFGLHVEPDNADIQAKIKWSQEQRAAKLPSVPGSIGEEKRTNPFMRVDVKEVQEFTKTIGNVIATMDALRTKKNSFK